MTWNNLSKQKRGYIFIAFLLLVSYLAYWLSFRNTIQAIALYNQLHSGAGTQDQFEGSAVEFKNKLKNDESVIKLYRVPVEDSQGRLWETVSGIAVATQVGISFSPDISKTTDSIDAKHNLITQQFSFDGAYPNLIRLVDSIEKTPGIGKISQLKLYAGRETTATDNLHLKITLIGIRR